MNEEENDYELTIKLNKISNGLKKGLISEDESNKLINDIANNKAKEITNQLFESQKIKKDFTAKDFFNNEKMPLDYEKIEVEKLFTDKEAFAPGQSIESQRLLDLITDENGIIHHDISISGKQILTFDKVKVIKGSLNLINSEINSLGSLEEIHGNFSVMDRFFKVKLDSLGSLKLVKGDLSLHHTSISKLNYLKSVGEILRLPKKLKSKIELSKIIIGDRVIFSEPLNKRKYYYKIEPVEKFNGNVPFWRSTYMYADNSPFTISMTYEEILNNATSEQVSFYFHFKESFYNKIFFDVEGNTNYLYILYFEIINDFEISKLKFLINLKNHYYQHLGKIIDLFIKDFFIRENKFDEALDLIIKSELGFNSQDIDLFIKKISHLSLSPELLFKILSNTTDRYDEETTRKLMLNLKLEIPKYEKKIKQKFFYQFFDEQLNIKSKDGFIDLEYYKNYFPDSFDYYLKLDKSSDFNFLEINSAKLSNVFYRAIWFELKKILENANNQLIKDENPEVFQAQIKKKNNRELLLNLKNAEYYDCKYEKILSIDEISNIEGKKILSSVFKKSKSLYGRYILAEGKENNKVFNQWKTIINIQTGEKKRFNKEGFAKYVGVDSRNVWKFFNNKQKQFLKKFEIFTDLNKKN